MKTYALPPFKVTDFGLSRVVCSVRHGLSKFHKPAGTLSYMSPQIVHNYVKYNDGLKSETRSYDPFKADIWALGVCQFLLLSKDHPFENPPANKSERADFARRMLVKQRNKDWRLPIIVRENIGDGCMDILECLLEPNAEQRPTIYDVVAHEWIKHGTRNRQEPAKQTNVSPALPFSSGLQNGDLKENVY